MLIFIIKMIIVTVATACVCIYVFKQIKNINVSLKKISRLQNIIKNIEFEKYKEALAELLAWRKLDHNYSDLLEVEIFLKNKVNEESKNV